MEVQMRPTDKIVHLVVDGTEVPARIWQGKTLSGIPCHMYVTRVAIDRDRPAHEVEEFERSLMRLIL